MATFTMHRLAFAVGGLLTAAGQASAVPPAAVIGRDFT